METPPSVRSQVNSLPLCPLIDFCCRQEVLNLCQMNKFKERLRASPQPAHISLWHYEKEATWKPTHQRRLHLSGMPTNEPCNGLTETQDKQMGRETSTSGSPPPHITSPPLFSSPARHLCTQWFVYLLRECQCNICLPLISPPAESFISPSERGAVGLVCRLDEKI